MVYPKKSLALRIWIIVVLAVIISTGSFCVVSLILTQNSIERSTKQRMLDIANCASGSVSGDSLKRLTIKDIGSAGYRNIHNTLAIFLNNVEAEYIYGIRAEEDGRFTYSVDPTMEDPTEFGSEIETTEALISASKGIAAVDGFPTTDEWGTFYSAYSPVFDSDGNVAGIIGVDFSREWYEGQLRAQTRKILLSSLIVLCIALIVAGSMCFVTIKAITSPIKKLTKVASEYQKGDFSQKIEINQDDEMGILSHALQSMASSLTEQIKKANEASKAKSTFLANMSHEIRTPINAVLGMNEMILRESSDPDILTYSENVKSAATTLLSIINDILDFSKIEAGKLEIILADYDLFILLNDLVNMIRPRVDAKDLMLELDFDSNTPRNLYGDFVRIKQIISNILTNAVKYTEKGSIKFHLSYEISPSDNDSIYLLVSVKDTGIGIKPEDMKKLFSEFERIEEERNTYIEGTGLGMSITKSLLSKMGSSLEVESTYGEGSNFHFALKQRVIGTEVLGDFIALSKHHQKQTKDYKEKFIAPKAQVLVVDDNNMNLMVFKNLLKQTLVITETASSGFEGLAMMKDKKYDIIFLDHMMPGMDGIETLHEMKKDKDNPNLTTPVVCLTANAISGAREQYISEGFDDYLTKPIISDDLEDMLVSYLPKELIESPSDEKKESSSDSMNISDRLAPLLNQNLIDIKTGISNNGGENDYLEMLKIFYNYADSNLEELNSYFNVEDFSNYTVKVHALKSSARIIGAIMLGNDAQRLEDAGKAQNYDQIRTLHEFFVKEFLAVTMIVEKVIIIKAPTLVADHWLIDEAYAQIKKAAHNLDYDAIEEVYKEMSLYAIPDEASILWEQVKKASLSMRYDEIEALIK
jgi:signal transduction histidine kinase/CheY-like chemotaxis protein/HPt (histidine-containing phosphotransfer) domain-containing protein